jgi:PKD repeat protein
MQRCLANLHITSYQFSFIVSLLFFLVWEWKELKKTSLMAFLGVSLLFLCLINPVSAVGIFRNSVGNWYLDYENTGENDISMHFGTTGDIGVTGDWNNDGISDMGIYRPSGGNWYLETAKTGAVYRTFHFGTTGDIPVTGDWNNDGISDIGVFRPSSGNWYLETAKTGAVYRTFHFGTTGDIPVTGDWNNDGISDMGVYRPSSGNWYLETAKTGAVYRTFHFGTTGDIPVIDDWDKDGISDIGVFRPSSGNWYLETTKTGAINRTFHFGTNGDKPTALKISPAQTIAPVADFVANVRSGTTPLTVAFIDQSTGLAPLTYTWDFTNDGVGDSVQQNPSFTYTTAGTYTVRHTVTNAAGSNVSTKTGFITVSTAPVAPIAAFSADVRSGYAPLAVHFTNQSTGTAPLAYAWDFTSDDEVDSNIASPAFTYTTPGTYTVTLTATNGAGIDSEVKNGYITVLEAPAPPVAAFTSNKRSGAAPLTVRFTDSSSGSSPMTYSWNFGDGGTSSDQNPTHTYTATGSYTVSLRATNSLGTDVATTTGYITVTEGQPGGSHAGIVITFDDQSVDEWYALRSMLQQHNAHVTFYVSYFGSLNQDQIDKLRILQSDGNEIAFHGLYHTDVVSYLQTHTVQQYMGYEIIPGINLMNNAGFNPVDFAYPYGSNTPAASQALEGYFGHIRLTHYDWDDAIYYTQGSNQAVITGIGLDELPYGRTIDEYYDGISRAKDEDKVLITYSHTPVQTVTGNYQTSYDRLGKILKYASDNNVRFYTVQELT